MENYGSNRKFVFSKLFFLRCLKLFRNLLRQNDVSEKPFNKVDIGLTLFLSALTYKMEIFNNVIDIINTI